MTAQTITEFKVVDDDESYQIRALGTLNFAGIAYTVVIEAFKEADDEGEPIGDFDWATADLILVPQTPMMAREIFEDAELKDLLLKRVTEFATKTLEGESKVCWGESGAQASRTLTFGRNGW